MIIVNEIKGETLAPWLTFNKCSWANEAFLENRK